MTLSVKNFRGVRFVTFATKTICFKNSFSTLIFSLLLPFPQNLLISFVVFPNHGKSKSTNST